nr:potassium transporter 19-like [Tanacetum cinerariifolium]
EPLEDPYDLPFGSARPLLPLYQHVQSNYGVLQEQEGRVVDQDLATLDRASQGGIVHLVGEHEIVSRMGSTIWKRFLIDYAYDFIKKNLRQSYYVFEIPQKRMLKNVFMNLGEKVGSKFNPQGFDFAELITMIGRKKGYNSEVWTLIIDILVSFKVGLWLIKGDETSIKVHKSKLGRILFGIMLGLIISHSQQSCRWIGVEANQQCTKKHIKTTLMADLVADSNNVAQGIYDIILIEPGEHGHGVKMKNLLMDGNIQEHENVFVEKPPKASISSNYGYGHEHSST